MNKKVSISLMIIGLVIMSYGLFAAISLHSTIWYSFFLIGGVLFLGAMNIFIGNNSVLKLIEKNKKRLFLIYIYYIVWTILIEIIGRFWLNLWYYPSFDSINQLIHVFIIGYPFAFFFIYESFLILEKIVKKFWLAVILTTIINAFLHEIPNTFAWEWVYTIPNVTFEILKINIVVIIAWVVLIIVPLIVNHKIIVKANK